MSSYANEHTKEQYAPKMFEVEDTPSSISSGQGYLDSHSEQENFSINIQTQPSQPVSSQSARSISFSLPAHQQAPDTTVGNVDLCRPPSQYVILSDIESYTKLGNSELGQGNIESALQAFLTAFKRSALLEDKKFLKICSLNLGAVYISLDKPRKGLQLLLQAATLNRSKDFEFDINFNFGLAYEALKHFEAAIHHFKLAIRYLERHSETPEAIYGEICHKLAKLHFNSGYIDKSTEFCQKACSFYEQNMNTIKFLSCHLLLADTLIHSHLNNEALISLDACAEILGSENKRILHHNHLPFYKELVLKYEEVEDFTSAIESAERALKFVDATLDTSSVNRSLFLEFRGEMYQCTGRIYKKMLSIEQALLDLDIASETFEQLEMNERAAMCYIDMAHICLEKDDQLQNSLFYAKSALSLVQGTGSVEEEQSLELLVVLYDKFGLNDKAVAAITASLSLISSRQSATGASTTVQRKHYSLLLQHFKDCLTKGPPSDVVDKTTAVNAGATKTADVTETHKVVSKGASQKAVKSTIVVDSGFSNSSDNSARALETPSTEDTDLTNVGPSTSKAEKLSKGKKRPSSVGDKQRQKEHGTAMNTSSKEKREKKNSNSRATFLKLDEKSRRRRGSNTSQGSISKKREIQLAESPIAKGLYVPGYAEADSTSSGTLTPSAASNGGSEAKMSGTALLQQYQQRLMMMQKDDSDERGSSDADYYDERNDTVKGLIQTSHQQDTHKKGGNNSEQDRRSEKKTVPGASLRGDEWSGSDTEYSSLRQSQSLTRKFFESHVLSVRNNSHVLNVRNGKSDDYGQDDDDQNSYGSLAVETRYPEAESIREHTRTTRGDTGQAKSIRRSTSKRSNGLGTHVSFDTVPVQDGRGFDGARPSIREHTAEIDVYGNSPLEASSSTYREIVEHVNPSSQLTVLKSQPPQTPSISSPATTNNLQNYPNVGKSSIYPDKKRKETRSNHAPKSKACTIL